MRDIGSMSAADLAWVLLRVEAEPGFWARVRRGEPDECWPFRGRVRPEDGRVQVWFAGKKVIAPRLAWELSAMQPIPDGLLVCHSCDNPPCCNPAHLWLGTPLQNVQDCYRKNRGKDRWKRE